MRVSYNNNKQIIPANLLNSPVQYQLLLLVYRILVLSETQGCSLPVLCLLPKMNFIAILESESKPS